jgi:2-polyprenyl-3-methyl-5-hydroxy-6-metoxy-1,4-benzoquinol methylase
MLERRASGPELMDGPGFGYQEVVETFRFLEPVNCWFGGIRPELSFFRRESRNWDRDRTYRILDAGCGVGDVPVALAEWSRRKGYRIRVDGVDKHPIIVELARRKCQDYPEISLFCQDVLKLKGKTYDYVHASQFLHLFPDEKVTHVLRHLLTMCQHRLVINDLVRAPLAYLATYLFTLWSSPVFRHDARISVKRGFKIGELERLLKDDGFRAFRLEKHFFFRFLLIVDKELFDSTA